MQRMTAQQVAKEVFGMSYHQFIRKMNEGEFTDIPHIRTGLGLRPRYLFYREKVEEWILNRMSKVPGNQRKAAI